MRPALQSLFGFDLTTAQKVIVASVVILVLLVLLGLFVRQIQGGRLRLKGQSGGRQRQPRLGVVDTHDLDRQRQLVLIRRDNVEHLIMIGGVSDVVVETNILRSGTRAAPPPPVDFAVTERPPAFETLAPQEPVRPEQPMASAVPETLSPLPLRPVPDPVASRPAPGQVQLDAAATAAAIVAPAGIAAAASLAPPIQAGSPSVSAGPPPNFSRDNAPSPTASAVELDSMARQLEEALKRPFSAVRPANSQDEPVRAPDLPKQADIIAPAPQPEAARPVSSAMPMTMPKEEAPTLPPPTPPAPPVTTGRPIPLPADVEAELEMALGLKPERINPVPAAMTPAQRPVEPTFVPEPARALEPATTIDVVKPMENPLVEGASESRPRTPAHKDGAADAPDAPVPKPGAAPEPEEPADGPDPAKAPDKKPAAIDPFSVDAIEAEFARLLGRDPKAKS